MTDPQMHAFVHLLLVLWLLPCALQDWRTRHVSNWLTVPLFLAAWPLALWFGGEERLVFTFAVFAGCWFAWQMRGMGAADGKIATALAALWPGALLASGLCLAAVFLFYRIRMQQVGRVPAVVGFYAGTVALSLWCDSLL